MTIDIRRAGSRFVTREEGRETFHCFSFGAHYDPHNTGFAAITALNDEHLAAGAGYADHPHRDAEIVTWVLEGELRHTDSLLGTRELRPGEVLCTSAGSGIVHSERATAQAPARFLQTWLRPDVAGGDPWLATARTRPTGELVEVVGAESTPIGVRGARLHLAQAATGRILLPAAPAMLLLVVDGNVEIGDRELAAGDWARLSDEAARAINVTSRASVAVWSFAR